MNQIQTRINQRSVKIKDQEAEAMRIKLAQVSNHRQFRSWTVQNSAGLNDRSSDVSHRNRIEAMSTALRR
jgi:hypothetical protein